MKPSHLITLVFSLLLGTMAAGAARQVPTGTLYLRHAGGCTVAKNERGRPVLAAADSPQALRFTITPLQDGYYSLALEDGGCLMLDGGYLASFEGDGTKKASQFYIEPAGPHYWKLRCRYNDKYLGTASCDAGAEVHLNKSGSDRGHHWFLASDLTSYQPADEINYVVNPYADRQQIEGWGVSLCWWANMCGKWSDDKIDEIIDWLVSPDGLNYNIFRYNIGGGDDPANANCTEHHMGGGKGLRAEMEGFKDSSDGEYIWSRDAAQRKIMLKIKEKRHDAIFEAFSNSAPYYMTYSGCCSGNTNASADNLKPEFYEEFCHYLVDVCKHYKDEYGIEFRTLDPFNEPMTSYWKANGGQEGCHFDVDSQIALLRILHPILQASGLNTVISASDETSVAQAVKDFKAFRDADVLKLIGQFNTHTYNADNNSRAELSALCANAGMPLWMSEVGAGGKGIEGNLNMAQKLINDVRFIAPKAWVDWQYIEENNDQWCMVKATSFAHGTYEKVKNYAVRSHFSRYIKPGYTILSCQNGQVLAARNPSGDQLVIVAINLGETSALHNVNLSMCNAVGNPTTAVVTTADADMADIANCVVDDKQLHFELPPLSIATIVVPVTPGGKPTHSLQPDAAYLLYPRTSAATVMDGDSLGVRLSELTLAPSQQWFVSATGTGYTFTNADGDKLTYTPDAYALQASAASAEGSIFTVTHAGGEYHIIACPQDNRCLDPSGKGSGHGTALGMWADETPANSPWHHWGFIQIPDELRNMGIVTPVADTPNVWPVQITAAPGSLTFTAQADTAYRVAIYDTTGRSVYYSETTDKHHMVSLSHGVYIVNLVQDNRKYGCIVRIH